MAGVRFRKVGDWAQVARITRTMQARFTRAVRIALMREAHFLRGEMVKGIASGAPGGRAFAPLSPLTIAMRRARGFGGTKPLNATGALRRGITVVQVGGGSSIGGRVFVGVHRQARNRAGQSLVNIAEIHEFGRSWTQPLSPKARRYLFAVMREAGVASLQGPRLPGGGFRSGGAAQVSIHIPARPFIRPIVEKHGRPADVKRRFLQNVADAMGGDFKLLGAGR